MRQPRTFSERLALLNRLNRRQAEEVDDVDSDDDDVAGLEDGVDSASESGDDDDISSTDGDIGEGNPAVSPDPGAALPPSAPPVAVEPPAAAPTTSAKPDPPVASPAPVKSDPPPALTTSAKPAPPAEAPTSTTSAKPEPTGIVINPVDPDPSSQEELSTTAQVISQITSAAGAEPTESASPSEAAPIVSSAPEASNSLVLGGQNGSPTASATAVAETTSGAAEAIESGSGGEVMNTGASVGITFGALAGLGLMVTVGLALYRWRKRRNAAVYDRPAPPGVYTSDEKQAAVMDAAMQAVYADDVNEGGPGRPYSEHDVSRRESAGAYEKVTSWIKDTANRVSQRTEWAFGPSQEPTFVRAEPPAREPTAGPVAGPVAEPIREPARAAKRATTMTTMTGVTGITSSEARWG